MKRLVRSIPVVPKVDSGVEERFTVVLRPRGAGVLPQKVVLLVRTNELALVGVFLNPVDRVDKAVLVASRELVTRNVVKQSFEIVGGRDTGFQQAVVNKFAPQIL